MEAGLRALLDTIGAYPGAAYAAVFAAALAESLAVIGAVMPGVLIILVAGALIADGVLGFWPVCLLVITGAVLGDSLSFWLGRRYKRQLRSLWPLNRHPAPLERGMAFFARHGAKSVALGRFVGPVRAMVPLVAGMMDMPTGRFVLANVGSAFLWAPAYLAPGILFGASLKLASEAATGLVFVTLSLIALFLATIWISQRLVRWASARASVWVGALLRWTDQLQRGHPLMAHIAAALADPRHPDAGTLAGLALALLSATLVLGLSLGLVLLGPENLGINQFARDLFLSLESPHADQSLATLGALGDPALLLVLVAVVFVYLRWHGRVRDAAYWLAAASFALIASPLLGLLIGTTRPSPASAADWPLLWPWSFPTPSVLGATLVYGFLALLIARALPGATRWLPFALASSLVGALSFARLYFGTEWLTDILASFTLALVWLAALGLAFARHTRPEPCTGTLASLVLIALLAWLPGYGLLSLDGQTQRLAHLRPEQPLTHIPPAQWLTGEPSTLASVRQDLRHQNHQPFDIQYAGPLPALASALSASGWQAGERLGWHNAPRLLSPSAALSELPLVSHVHQGLHEQLIHTHDRPDGRRYVLRLWPTRYLIDDIGPLWIGDITEVTKERVAGLFALPITLAGTQYDERRALVRELGKHAEIALHRNGLLRISHLAPVARPKAAAAAAAPASDPTPAPP
ncbi:Inner membrane protein YabI [Thiorhodovibrio winogradskyi]|uniref:Inner membrane protein YabI n=1 Tax=Thiorhodovibrio winogradskyi TaxID=77007 RepID=A0ABZ0S4A2_9GAMM|nr:VTT domain-containing protein [Thiorhodovibrio winogradskyi]